MTEAELILGIWGGETQGLNMAGLVPALFLMLVFLANEDVIFRGNVDDDLAVMCVSASSPDFSFPRMVWQAVSMWMTPFAGGRESTSLSVIRRTRLRSSGLSLRWRC